MMPDELRVLEPLCSRTTQNVAKIPSRVQTDSEKKDDKNIWLRNLSDFAPDLRLRGLRASKGGCDFARWFSIIPPDVMVDKDFTCDEGILRKDFFISSGMLDKYLGFSAVV